MDCSASMRVSIRGQMLPICRLHHDPSRNKCVDPDAEAPRSRASPFVNSMRAGLRRHVGRKFEPMRVLTDPKLMIEPPPSRFICG